MQEGSDFNVDEQAMLEEAFATIFTDAGEGGRYDEHLKRPDLFHEEAESIIDEKKTPLFRGIIMGERPMFTDKEDGEQATSMIKEFLAHNQSALAGNDTLAHLALFSQGAAFAETLGSDIFEALPSDQKLVFIKEQLGVAQQNIDSLVSGEVPDGKSEKYRKTVSLTRESFTQSMQRIEKQPDKPVFVELLLETLSPLYEKAKAQSDAIFERLSDGEQSDV